MKLMTEKYTIEYKYAYENGVEVQLFDVMINDVSIYIEYSYEQNAIITIGVNSVDLDKDDVDNALELCEYAEFELKNVCRFMLDLI